MEFMGVPPYHSVKDFVKEALSHRKRATENNDTEQEGKLKTYCKIIIHLLSTYATYDVDVSAQADIINSKHPTNMSAARYSDAL